MLALRNALVGLIVGVLACVPATGRADETTPAVAAAVTSPRPLMWVVRDQDSTIYLFGSVHVMRDGIDWLTPAIRDRFDASDEVWFEIGDIDDTARLMQVARRYMSNPKGNMTDGLSKDEVRDLDRRLGQYGMTSRNLMGLHKWAVGLVLVQRQLAAMGLESANGIDMTLVHRAQAAKIPVKGFETMEQQMEALQARNDDEDIAALRLTLKEMDETPKIVSDLIAAWLSGDEPVLEHYLVDKIKVDDPETYQRLMIARNQLWAPQIEALLAGKGTVFITVGTGHLVGPDSVVAILRKDGVKVEAVTTNP